MFKTAAKSSRRPRPVRPCGPERLEDRTVPATVYWDGGAGNSNWNAAANWATNALPGPDDDVIIPATFTGITVTHSSNTTRVRSVSSHVNVTVSGGTFDFGTSSDFYGEFALTGGRLEGTGDFHDTFTWTGGTLDATVYPYADANISGQVSTDGGSINADFWGGEVNWTSGTISAAVPGGYLTVRGDFHTSGAGDKRLNGVHLSAWGRTDWTGAGDLVLDNRASFDSFDTFEARASASLESRIVPAGDFISHGPFVTDQALRVGGGGLQFRHYDTVELETAASALHVVGGETFLRGPWAGPGHLWVDGGTVRVEQALTLEDVRVDAGELSVNEVLTAPRLELAGGQVTGLADLVVPDLMLWSGGTLGGTGRLIVSNQARLQLLGGTHWFGGRPIDLAAFAARIEWLGGTLRGDGPGRQMTLDGRLVLSGDTARALRDMTLVQHGTTTWDGAGNLQLDEGAEFVNAPGAVFDVEADVDVSLLSTRLPRGKFTNQGTFRTSGAGTVRVGAGGLLFDNAGTLETPAGTLQLDDGRLNLNDGTAVTPESWLRVNGGTLAVNTQVEVANLRVDGGTLAVLARLTAPGLHLAGGTLTGPANLVIPADSSMQWTGGTLGGAGQVRVEAGAVLDLPGGTLGVPTYDGRPITLDPTAAVNWTAGLLTDGPLTLDGRLNIGGTAPKTLRAMTLTQLGPTAWTGTGDLRLDEGAVFHNQASGLFEIQTDRSLLTVKGPVGTFLNTGKLRKSGTTGTTTIGAGGLVYNNPGTFEIQGGTVSLTGPNGRTAFVNTGVVAVQSGTLSAAGNYTQSAGRTVVQGILRPTGIVDVQGGELAGTGTVQGRVVNSGRLAPGLSPGVLTINGNYTQTPQGELVLEVDGYGTGAGHDQLRVNGTVTLGGTLTLLGDFLPAAGDSFPLLDNDLADAVAGTFSGLAEGAALGSNGRSFRLSYRGGNGHDNDVVAFFAGALPVLAPIGDQAVDEGGTLSFTAAATDADVPAQALTYSLVGAPDGATIDPTTGMFAWTPTEAQGPGTFAFTVRVTDDGQPSLADEESITVTVNEANAPPELGALTGDHEVDEGSTLNFTATATDADLPANGLTFGLDGAPAGATIDPATGVFSWTPAEDDGPGIYTFRVVVTDDGTPALSDGATVTVIVREADHVRPAAGVTGPGDGVRNQPRRFVLTADDADPADMAAGFRFAVDWGDGSPPLVIDPTPDNGAGLPVDHAYTAVGDYTVRVTATDQNGAVSDTATHTITIARVALQDDPLAPGGLMLAVGGGPTDDLIRVRRGTGAGNLVVLMNGVREGLFRPTSRVVAFGGDGNDPINILPGVRLPAWASGGAGDDDLFAGGGPAVLLGGDGADALSGRAGRDLLIGGAGTDSLAGRAGDDLLIDGTTAFDADEAALAALQAEWLSANDYPTRVANVRANFLATEGSDRTVFDDGAADFLAGHLGRDIYFANLDAGVLDLLFRPAANEDRFDVD